MMKRGLLNKAVAAAAVGSMLVSGTSTAWAGTFSDWAKEKVTANTAVIAESWDQSLNEVGQGTSGYADVAVHLEDTGRAMASMLLSGNGLDISWLENLGIKMDFSYEEGKEAAVINLYANDQSILNMLMDIDLSGKAIKAMLPELSDSAITVPFEMDFDDEESEQAFKIYQDIMKDPKAVLPNGEVVKDLFDRYTTIVYDHFEDGKIEDTTVTVDGVTEEAKLYEGTVDGEALLEMTKEILTTAKDDEQIKEVLDNIDAASEDLSGTFEKMQSGIDKALEEISEDGEVPNVSLIYDFYEDADGNLIGVSYQIDSLSTGDDEEVIGGTDTSMKFSYLQPADGEKTGLEMAFDFDDTKVALSGSGSTSEGIANGEYQVLYNGDAVATATVADLDTNTWKAGTISLALNENKPDEATYQSVGAFNLVVSFGEDSAQNPAVDLAILYAGSSLGSIRISGGEAAGDVDISALDAAANVYDTENEDDMTAFMGSISLDTILANITAAGAPEGFAESLISMITGSGEDYADYEYDDYEYEDYDYAAEDTEDGVEEDAAA